MSLKLIVITNIFPTNRPILSSLLNKEFVSRGNEISWIVSSNRVSNKLIKTKWGSSDIYILPNRKNTNKLSGLINFIVNIWTKFRLCIFIIEKKAIDVVHFHDTCFENLIGIYSKTFFRIQMSIAYTAPFILMKRKLANKSRGISFFFRKLWYLLFKKVYSLSFLYSDHIFPISESLGRKMALSYSIPNSKIVPIGESASNLFLRHNRIENLLESNSKIVYVGYMHRERNLEFLLRSFRLVLDVYSKVELQFLGWSNKEKDIPNLKNYCKKLNLENNVKFLGKVSYNKVPEIILKSNIGVSPIPPIDVYLDSTPTKVVEYLSLGIPVVANEEIEDQKDIIIKSKGGITVEYDEKKFAEGLLSLLHNPANARSMGQRGKSWIMKNRTFQQSAKLIEKKYLDYTIQ